MGLYGDGGKAAQEKAIEQQYKYDQEMWSFNWNTALDDFAFQNEGLAIRTMNETAQRNWQDQTNFNGWLNRENMRMYSFDKEVEAYNASVESYERQLDYNNIAYDIALNDANRVYQDQLIGFGFQNQDLLMKYHEGGEQASLDTKGLTNKIGQAQRLSDLQTKQTKTSKEWDQVQAALEDAGLRQGLAAVKAEGAFKAQGERLAYLDKEGKQRNLGQAGRSAGKAISALLATHGTTQAAMADSISRAENKYSLDKRRISETLVNKAKMTNLRYTEIANSLNDTVQDAQQQQDQIGLKFSQLKDRTDFNRLQLQQSMISAGEQHEANKTKLSMDKYQQDINASAALMAKPTLPPQELDPVGLPVPDYQKPAMPNMPPKPLKGAVTAQGPSTMSKISTGVSTAYAAWQLFTLMGSDIELKENIVRKGRSPRGFPIYEFNYKHEPNHRYQGVMGQDLLELLPSAVVEADNGYLAVDYSQLDVEFKEV